MVNAHGNFHYNELSLWVDDVNVEEIIQCFGTPTYVYSHSMIKQNWQFITETFGQALKGKKEPIFAYAVKANSHLMILSTLAKMGACFDVVSGGELQRVLRAGVHPKKIFFSGVGKTEQEIREAINNDIGCIHVESEEELIRIEKLALGENRCISVALRINPNVNPKTHPYIATGLKENKFGIEWRQAKQLYLQREKFPHLKFIGIACHIGSQISECKPYMEALQSLLSLYDDLVNQGFTIEYLDLGGGFGITYTDESPLDVSQLAASVSSMIGERPVRVMLEPGRSIVGNAGILLTKVEYLKENQEKTFEKKFAIVDAGMNDLLRPALYQAIHPIWPVKVPDHSFEEKSYDVVGPICETSDYFVKNQPLPASLKAGDYLAIGVAGAYGFSMSSQYNTRPRAAEVWVDGDKATLIRARETVDDLIFHERII